MSDVSINTIDKTIEDAERRIFIAKAVAVAAAGTSGLVSSMAQAEEAAPATGVLHPVRLDPAHLAGKGLDPLGPWPAAMLLRPIATHRALQWYTGEKLSAMVYDADDGLIKLIDLPYDEHVVVLNGTATLTSLDGKVEVFTKGDVFMAPKGWSGTWELSGGYRELICFETKSLEYAMKKWFS